MTKPRRDFAETRLQQAIVQFLTLNGADDVVWFHCPNERKAGPQEHAFLKTLGVVPGVPDLAFILPDGRAAFMECKRPANKVRGQGAGYLTSEQRAFFKAVEARGCKTAIVRTIDEALAVLASWGALKRNARVAA